MEKLYNKDVRTLQHEMDTEHKKQEKEYGKSYSVELRDAAQNVSKKTLTALENQWQRILDSDCDDATKKKLEMKRIALKNAITEYTKPIWYTEFWTSHEKHLNQLAQRIDNAENEIAGMIEDIWRKQELQATKESIGTKYFKELPKWWLQLTAATNAPRIDQILGKLIQPGKVWKIDYSWCSNEKLKNIMMQAMGWFSGYILQGIDNTGKNTFVVLNAKWEQINQRALIREWVTLYPSAALVDEAIKQQQNKTNQLRKVDDWKISILRSELSKQTWLSNALWEKKDAFIKIAEEKLHNTIVYAKKHGWELHSESITKNWTWSSLLDIHLVNWTGEKDVWLFYKKTTDKSIYDILDSNEWDLVQYMTARLKKKRNEYGHLDKVNTIAVWRQEIWKQTTILNDGQKEQVKKGLQWLTTMVQNMIDAEGDTKFWTRDEKLRALSSYLRDVMVAVTTGKNLTQYDIDKFSSQIATLYKKAYNLHDISTSRDWIQTHRYDTKKDVKTILLWTPQQAADAMRLLWERTTLWSNTHTSFLVDDIANDTKRIDTNKDWKITDDETQTESTMKIEKTTYNDCFQRIETLLWTNNPWSIAKIDEMYAIWSAKDLFDWFVENWLLPKSAEFKNPLMRDRWLKSRTEAIFNQLKVTEKQIANKDAITANARRERAEEKRILETKWILNEQEMQRLQVLHVMEQDTTIADEMIAWVLDEMRYMWVADMVRSELAPRLVKEWWWVISWNADLYNDVVWARWWWDFSDENALMMQQTIATIVEEVVIWLIAIWAWIVTWWAATALIYGARLGRYATKANKLLSLSKLYAHWKRAKGMIDAGKAARLANTTNKLQKAKIMLTPSRTWALSSLTGGAAFAAVNTTLKGKWETMTPEDFAWEVVYGASMVGVLQLAGKLFPWRNIAWFFKRVWTEEWVINSVDRSRTRLTGNNMTGEDVAVNVFLWIIFEWIMWMKWMEFKSKAEAKNEIDKILRTPEGKQKFKEALDKYEWVKIGDQKQTTRQKYQEALERDNAEISRIRYETQWLEKQRSVLYDQLVKDPQNKWIEQKIHDIEAHILRNESALKYLEESSMRMHDKSKKIYDEKSPNQTHGTEFSRKIKEQMERENKQWKYAWELATWMLMVEKLPNVWLPDAIKKLKSPDWFWKDDVIALQKEIWLTGKDVDGVFWPKTLKKLEAYLQDMKVNKITKEDLLITKDILREDAMRNWIGDKKAFFAEVKANGGKITIDGVEYMVKQWKDRIEIATLWVWWWKKPLSDGQKSDLFDRYQQQKVEEFINNHPDVKNAKIIDEAVVKQQENVSKIDEVQLPAEKLLSEITLEGLTILPAVATYFKNNPIPESIAKKLNAEDINNIDAYLTDALYKDWYKWATREQMVQNYLRDVVGKRVDVSSRIELKKSEIAEIKEIVESIPKNDVEAINQWNRLLTYLKGKKENVSNMIAKINLWIDNLEDSIRKLPVIKQLREYVQIHWSKRLVTTDNLSQSLQWGLEMNTKKITREWVAKIKQYYPDIKVWDIIVELHIDPSFDMNQAKMWLVDFLQNQWKDAKMVYGMSHLTVLWKRFGFDIHMDKTLQQNAWVKDYIFDPINDASHAFVKKHNVKIPEGVTIKEYFKKNPDKYNKFKEESSRTNKDNAKLIDMRMKYDVKDIGLMLQSPKKLLERLTWVKQDEVIIDVKKQIPRIEHNFVKSPELKVSNQEVVLSLKEWEQYSLLLGDSEYVISKSEWKVFIENKWDLEGIWLEIIAGREYVVGRNHTELTWKIEDKTVSREHMSIKIDNKGNVIVRDLNSTYKTWLRKENNILQETKNKLFQKYWMETNSYGPWTFFNRWKNQYQSYMGEEVNVFKQELLSEDIKSDFKIFLHPKPEFFNEVIEKMMLALKDEKNLLWKMSSNWPWLNVKNPQILLYIKWNQNEVNRIMQLLHKQLQSIEKQASFPRKRTDKWSFVSDDNAPSFLAPFKWGIKDWEPQWLIWYGQWEWWLKRNIAESGNADFYLYWENNAFIKETSIKKKNANETWLYKTVDQYNYNDRDILNKINNTESVEWKITNAARTHRTWIDELEKILDSNLLGSNEDRGIQFWWGLWSWYWDITIIMKDEVSQVWRPASVTHWSVSADNPRIHYFHWSAQQEWMAWSDYKNKIDFARNKWTKAQSDVPYLSIWWKNTDVNSDLENQVSANLIQAVMLPSHVKNYPWYKNILWKLKQKWIDVIHVDTQPSILDYSWSSIIDAVTRNRKSKINKMIIQELNVKYPSLNNLEDKVKQYLIDTKRIDTKDKWKSLQEIRNEYFNSFALNNWISRGSERRWQYENYWSYANYNIEEKAYFWYMLFLKNNPQSKWNEFDQSMLLWGKIDQNNLNHTVLFRN
jgi:hypothetical protein